MSKIAESLLPWQVRTHTDSGNVDMSEAEAFLEGFSEVDVFAFLGVPGEMRERYLSESLEMLLDLEKVGKVFAPEDYQGFLDEELRGLKIHYHSPESRREEFENIAELSEIETLMAPTMDYTVPRNYSEASEVFEGLSAPQDNILLDFEDFRQADGSLYSYFLADIQALRGNDRSKGTDYDVNDSEVVFLGIQYSEDAEDYFGLNFFSPRSEAVRSMLSQDVKDIPKKFLDFEY